MKRQSWSKRRREKKRTWAKNSWRGHEPSSNAPKMERRFSCT